MLVASETVDVAGIRAFVVRPVASRRWPVVIGWSDIFQLTAPHLRLMTRLASRGFVVIAPELYGRIVEKGTVFDFDADRQAALDASAALRLAWIDEDVRALLDAVAAREDAGAIGVAGWCFGGHVALRAALDPRVRAAACCYPTGLHDGKLGDHDGKSSRAGTLERAGEIRSDVLLVWGREDPHIPAEGRAKIHAALDGAGVRFEARLFDAQHTFMRDQGARYDGAAADAAFEAMVALFARCLAP